MSQSRDQLPITDSRLELAGACQLKVVITLRLSTQTHDTIHENQQTILWAAGSTPVEHRSAASTVHT